MELTAETEQERRTNKLYVDLYEGQGKDNPSVIARLCLLEVAVEKIAANLNKMVWLLLGIALTAGANLALHIAGK